MAISAAIVLPVFIAYAISGFSAALAALLRPLPPLYPDPRSGQSRWYDGLWRFAAIAGLWLLAFGTACDNLRTFAGGFAFSVPDGVFGLHNSTLAAELLAERGGAPTDFNYVVSVFCFFAHEGLGSTFILPGTYLWAYAASLSSASRKTPTCARDGACCTQRNVIAAASCVLLALGFALGISGFAEHTASTALVLEWNDELSVWTWGSGDENPFGLFGVFLSSGVWIVIGALLWCRLGVCWFFVLQIVAFVGQGASAALGDAAGLSSNLCEQLVTWALLGFGWQLDSKLRYRTMTTSAFATSSTAGSNFEVG